MIHIGRVTRRKNARSHLVVGERAHCNAGGSRDVIADTLDEACSAYLLRSVICRRCRKALIAALTAESDAGADYATDALVTLTPPPADEQARLDAAMLDGIRANVAAANPAPAFSGGFYTDRAIQLRRELLAA